VAGRERYKRMVDTVGEIAAGQMVSRFGEPYYAIPSLKKVIWSHAKDAIRQEFDALTTTDGLSSPSAVFELGIKYRVAGRTIEKILKTL